MICSLLNFTKECSSIADVNCYLLFADLEKKDSIEKNHAIGNSEDEVHIAKEDVTEIFDEINLNYEYKEINISKMREITDIFLEILAYSSKHSIAEE